MLISIDGQLDSGIKYLEDDSSSGELARYIDTKSN